MDSSNNSLSGRAGIDTLIPEIWMIIFEYLRKPHLYPSEELAPTWSSWTDFSSPCEPYRRGFIPRELRLVSRRIEAVATPLVFAKYVLRPQFFGTGDSAETCPERVGELVRTHSRCIVTRSDDLHWPSVVSFLSECKALRDYVWENHSRDSPGLAPELKNLLRRQLSHVRLHVHSVDLYDYFPIDTFPSSNIASLGFHTGDHDFFDIVKHSREWLHHLLVAAKQLKSLYLWEMIDLSPGTGSMPLLEDLIMCGWSYTSSSKGNPKRWDFSNLRNLEIRLPHIHDVLEEVCDGDFPKLKTLILSSPVLLHGLRYPYHSAHLSHFSSTDAIKFLDRDMPKLESLELFCDQPSLLLPTLQKRAPALKTLRLDDNYPGIFTSLRLCGWWPSLEELHIDLPGEFLGIEDEELYARSLLCSPNLETLVIHFHGSWYKTQPIIAGGSVPGVEDPIDKLTPTGKKEYQNAVERVKGYILRRKQGRPLYSLYVTIVDYAHVGEYSSSRGVLAGMFLWDVDREVSEPVEASGIFDI